MPRPTFWAVSFAMARASPVTILTVMPMLRAVAMVAFGVLARRVEQREYSEEPPVAVAVGAGHAQGPKASRREVVHRGVHRRLAPARVGGQRQDHLRGSLGDREGRPVAAVTVAAVRLRTGSKGWKSVTRKLLSDGWVACAPRTAGSMGSSSSTREASAAARITSSAPTPVHGERIAQGQRVLGQRAGLVRTQHVHAGQLLDGHEPADDGLLRGEQAGPDRHRHRQHGGHGDRDRGHGQDQSELQGGQDRVAAHEGDGDDHGDEH